VYERLGIPTVATVPWTTDRLLRAIVPEGLISEWRDPSGTVAVVNLPYHEGWIGRPLAELERSVGVHTAFVVRFGNGVLPSSNTVVQEGDTIYVAALAGTIHDVAELATTPPEGA
jgi:trk system potassium uptake protein TrkA